MRTSSTFSILFWIYSKRVKNNQAPLYARMTVDKQKLNISLKRRIHIGLWDTQKQRIKGISEKSRSINQYLDEVYSKLFLCYQELRNEDKRITPQAIKSKFIGDYKTERYTLRDIIEYHNTNMFSKLHYNTSRLYITSQNYILLFLKKKYKVEDIELVDLDYKFILDFESFLRKHKPRNYRNKIGNNAVMKHIQRLRRMITLAYHFLSCLQDKIRKHYVLSSPRYKIKIIQNLLIVIIRE